MKSTNCKHGKSNDKLVKDTNMVMKKRELGILKGKVKVIFKPDFKMSTEEFLNENFKLYS